MAKYLNPDDAMANRNVKGNAKKNLATGKGIASSAAIGNIGKYKGSDAIEWHLSQLADLARKRVKGGPISSPKIKLSVKKTKVNKRGR